MCLYPRLIKNPKYKRNIKNGGVIPPVFDKRQQFVPVGCQTCIECRKQKARAWQMRLMEDIKEHRNGKFVTLTFSTKSLIELSQLEGVLGKEGYDLDNAIVTVAVRRFLERWRKKYKRSVRHWLVTELGHGDSEHIHLHGIIWFDDAKEIEKIWQYGFVWKGYERNDGSVENYVNGKTVNYIIKYLNKIDTDHLNYKSIVLCSPGIGQCYDTSGRIRVNKYKPGRTDEAYRTESGHKIGLPIYWRNKIYSDRERELLWLEKLDKNERFVCGERVSIENEEEEEEYYKLVSYHRRRTEALGYPKPDFIWKKKKYEEERRAMLHKERWGIHSPASPEKYEGVHET